MPVRSSAPIALRYSASIRAWAHTKLIRQIVLTVKWTEHAFGPFIERTDGHSGLCPLTGDLSHGSNERSHRHRVRWNRLSRPPHRSASALSRISRPYRVKASGSGTPTVWS